MLWTDGYTITSPLINDSRSIDTRFLRAPLHITYTDVVDDRQRGPPGERRRTFQCVSQQVLANHTYVQIQVLMMRATTLYLYWNLEEVVYVTMFPRTPSGSDLSLSLLTGAQRSMLTVIDWHPTIDHDHIHIHTTRRPPQSR